MNAVQRDVIKSAVCASPDDPDPICECYKAYRKRCWEADGLIPGDPRHDRLQAETNILNAALIGTRATTLFGVLMKLDDLCEVQLDDMAVNSWQKKMLVSATIDLTEIAEHLYKITQWPSSISTTLA